MFSFLCTILCSKNHSNFCVYLHSKINFVIINYDHINSKINFLKVYNFIFCLQNSIFLLEFWIEYRKMFEFWTEYRKNIEFCNKI